MSPQSSKPTAASLRDPRVPGPTAHAPPDRLLWDSTETYRALYYNSPAERQESIDAHDRILDALHARDADRLVEELAAHRSRALAVLRDILA
jgi:DNA-binding GntR family transcriptional regulator